MPQALQPGSSNAITALLHSHGCFYQLISEHFEFTDDSNHPPPLTQCPLPVFFIVGRWCHTYARNGCGPGKV